MLTREDLTSERIDQIVADARAAGYDFFLSSEEREASLNKALARCQPGEDVWVFAYGSLMWNPALDYAAIGGLSREMIERLSKARPETLGQAARIDGVTPAALTAIMVHSRRRAA
mgnify:CR=1 FL=1